MVQADPDGRGGSKSGVLWESFGVIGGHLEVIWGSWEAEADS